MSPDTRVSRISAKEDIYWSFEDPAKFEGTDKARQVFMAVRDAIAQRIRLFLLAHRVGVETTSVEGTPR